MNSSPLRSASFPLACLALAGALAFSLSRVNAMPQYAQGQDVLSVAFGDAREVISRVAVEKADSYFHGGIDMDCDCEVGKAGGCGHEVEKVGGGGHEVEKVGGGGDSGVDWWRWIDEHIRAPQEHRHLEGGEAVEMIPWLWASVRTDPHNAEAWSTAWYVAGTIMKDSALAERVLAEALEKNPDSIEIAFTVGRARYDGGKGDLEAAREAFERTRRLGDAKCGGDVSKLTVREEEAYRFAGNYLKYLEEVKR